MMSNEKEYKPFEYEEHTADVIIRAYGRTLEETIANAAKAVFGIITNIEKVEPKICKEVEERGIDLYQAILRWLESFLVYFDSEGLVFSEFKVEKVEKENDEYVVKGVGCGEPFDPEKHEAGTIVKAITYHEMKLERTDGLWVLRFAVDI